MGDEDINLLGTSPVARLGEKKILKKMYIIIIIIEAPSIFGSVYNIMQMGPPPDGNICSRIHMRLYRKKGL